MTCVCTEVKTLLALAEKTKGLLLIETAAGAAERRPLLAYSLIVEGTNDFTLLLS